MFIKKRKFETFVTANGWAVEDTVQEKLRIGCKEFDPHEIYMNLEALLVHNLTETLLYTTKLSSEKLRATFSGIAVTSYDRVLHHVSWEDAKKLHGALKNYLGEK